MPLQCAAALIAALAGVATLAKCAMDIVVRRRRLSPGALSTEHAGRVGFQEAAKAN